MNTKHLQVGDDDDDDDVPLPGFRFHPTDQELVTFYLQRKLDKKPISFDLIKQVDIYKYDPWDLPKSSVHGAEKEGYFFCKRGRKYRNSVRPNRVTGSGFWKATGIDKAIYSNGGEGNDCVGLKKTLVYYRGSAGKGTKTDWMMHEFRLPPNIATSTSANIDHAKNDNDVSHEAEIWTLCRIFKRNVPPRKQQIPEVKPLANKHQIIHEKNSRMNDMEFGANQQTYINFGASHHHQRVNEHQHVDSCGRIDQMNQFHVGQMSSSVAHQPQQHNVTQSSNYWINQAANELLSFDNWDELGSAVKFSVDSPSL